MNADLFMLIGSLALVGSAWSTVTAFSSSNTTFRPALAFFVLGLTFIFVALSQNTKGYTFADLPQVYARAITGLFGG